MFRMMKSQAKMIPHSIELHDSRISAIYRVDDSKVVHFSHAYVHKNAKGWSQIADIVIGSREATGARMDVPTSISDGHVLTQAEFYDNLLPLPFSIEGFVALEIIFTSGAHLKIIGSSPKIILLTEAVFIEDVPFDQVVT